MDEVTSKKRELEMIVEGENVWVNRNQLGEFLVHTFGISKRHRSSFKHDSGYESGTEDDVFISVPVNELDTLNTLLDAETRLEKVDKEKKAKAGLMALSLMAVLTIGLFTFFRNW